MNTAPVDRSPRDGFTLIEVVVVVTMIAVIGAVLAATFVVIARTTPASANRVDDARSLLNLTNWLPQDVGSTSESGFSRGDNPTGCDSGTVPASQGLLELQWSEGATTYVVNYRFVDDTADIGSIVRYSCLLGGPATAINMTAPLQKIPGGTQSEQPAPVDIVLEPTTMANGMPGVRGLQFEVRVVDDDGVTQRELLSLDVYTANVVTTLPPTTTTTTAPNSAPIAYDMWVTINLDAAPFTITLPAVDPDGDSIAISAPDIVADPELNLTIGAGLDIDVQALTSLGAINNGTYEFFYKVADTSSALSNEGTVSVFVFNVPTPTTSTTLPTCTASFDPVTPTDPSTISLRPNGRLQDDLTINITTNGNCTPLVVTFDPMPNDANMTPEAIAFGGLTSVTIDKNAYTWDAAETSFEFTLRQGANGLPEDTHTVAVVP
ncbi:MAG: prepilin-type N-terminal cleavage/methylation domain-containing protein [Ilumatobacter sp.]|uniref:prepilin-type N-terminal cleavage/methylation domain-containing protein n=1 Tax=Ilumatobacter sp. TaxID=1967498 RepID=UPI00260BCA6B|nr:prepilin-type N-terminal cleavage/methylation domain-containing protein [Ilumatobacter sp.]MDJ0770135.1 prepilin-type N-terminal cleavage/methylation domain-containing protein [Ilumatobacter sp.]